jgi:hypothetical protein
MLRVNEGSKMDILEKDNELNDPSNELISPISRSRIVDGSNTPSKSMS